MTYNTNDIFSALADSSRRDILVMLSKGEKSVNSIAEHFRISRPAVSKHLRVLRKSRLIKERKSGRQRLLSFNPSPMNEVFKWLKFYDKFWTDKLNLLKKYVEEQK
jgi:DNA-binding transcriptional ArsR family regulator